MKFPRFFALTHPYDYARDRANALFKVCIDHLIYVVLIASHYLNVLVNVLLIFLCFLILS